MVLAGCTVLHKLLEDKIVNNRLGALETRRNVAACTKQTATCYFWQYYILVSISFSFQGDNILFNAFLAHIEKNVLIKHLYAQNINIQKVFPAPCVALISCLPKDPRLAC